ncbi:MAG: ABC transporter permease, partial [Longimicrobiales bacterium]
GDDDLVGRDVTLEGRPVTVVGILPEGFAGLSSRGRFWVTPHAAAQLIRPFMVTAAQAHWLQGVGRLQPTARLEALNDAMAAVGRAAEAVAPSDDPNTVRSGAARSLMDVRVGERARRSLVVLVLASGLLLLVACANLGGLLLARSAARRRESAVRAALGAGRWRVARGHLVVSLVLALLGGAASIGVAWAASSWLTRAWPTRSLSDAWNVDVAGLGSAVPGVWTVAFAAGLSVVVGLLLGLIPVFATTRARAADHLREGTVGRRATSGRGVRGALVAGEIAVALVLVVGAGLLLRSLQALNDVDRGYAPGDLLTFQLRTPSSSAWADDLTAFHELVEARLAALPEVEAVGMGCVAPVSGHCMLTGVRRAGDRSWNEGDRPGIGVHYVSDAWFATLGVETIRGRTFDSRDQRGSAPVVVLSEQAARELFPDGDALGNRIAMGVSLTSESTGATAEVVGVVGDVLYDRPENALMAEAYISHRQ